MIGAYQWQPRNLPLAPTAVAARGDASHAMARRLLARSDADLAALRGVTGEETLLVLGPEDKLPWVDGALYLGRDPQAPSLLLPTYLEPSLSAALLERALLAAFPAHPPLALLPSEGTLLSANAARPILRSLLLAWLENRP